MDNTMDNFKWIRVQEQDHPIHGGQVMIAFMLYNQGPFHQGGRYDCGVWEIGSKANTNVTVLAWAEIPRFKPLLVVDGTESDGFTLSECGCNASFWGVHCRHSRECAGAI